MKLTSKTINYTVETVDELLTLAGEENAVVVVTDENRGGTFVYRSSKATTNDGGVTFNGWCRQYSGAVNVKWFGAVGDGVTDNTLVFQNILDNGGTYFIPKGTYKITDDTTFTSSAASPKDLHIIGEVGTSITFTTANINIYKTNYTSNIIFDNIHFIGDLETTTYIKLNSALVTISNCEFSNFYTCLYVGQTYQDIHNNIFRNSTYGIAWDVTTGYYNSNSIANNFFKDLIVGVILESTTPAAGVSSGILVNNRLINNTFEGCTSIGIKLGHVNTTLIDNNYFEDTPTNIYGLNFSKNITILNSFTSSSQDDTSIKLDDSSASISGKLRDIELANSSTLSIDTDTTIGTLTQDASSKLYYSNNRISSTVWTPFPLAGTWSNVAGVYRVLSVSRDSNTIYVDGAVSGGASGSIIGVLPIGFRPPYNVAFMVINVTTGSSASIVIKQDGSINHIAGSTGAIALNVSFSL